mmetsp:Transcript_11168/g.28637  ORF Transcript_11168/g.28637 Transcript_11168/m.28637 type:complete len:237 (+) Transcript_11168:335-1045(+)
MTQLSTKYRLWRASCWMESCQTATAKSASTGGHYLWTRWQKLRARALPVRAVRQSRPGRAAPVTNPLQRRRRLGVSWAFATPPLQTDQPLPPYVLSPPRCLAPSQARMRSLSIMPTCEERLRHARRAPPLRAKEAAAMTVLLPVVSEVAPACQRVPKFERLIAASSILAVVRHAPVPRTLTRRRRWKQTAPTAPTVVAMPVTMKASTKPGSQHNPRHWHLLQAFYPRDRHPGSRAI